MHVQIILSLLRITRALIELNNSRCFGIPRRLHSRHRSHSTYWSSIHRLHDTIGELEAYVGGKVRLSKIGLIIKPRKGGGVKLRLITDLLRSRGNEFLIAPERIVLPRLSDALWDAIRLQRLRKVDTPELLGSKLHTLVGPRSPRPDSHEGPLQR